ncbi:MAG: type I-U CRISPR-associated RAMP protein Csb1/Cas7u [Planctomycetes bacterium]|nr:type I-U CRISPR-associated RAMP protein Csb1/Cas7u [Planctomycetota bacterium]
MPETNSDPISQLKGATRLLMTIPLKPLQGDRFQPTGFPSLGAATYQTRDGTKLLVESAQSMANRLEMTCWDTATNKPIADLDGISHITVNSGDRFLTDSMLEAHRLNSAYIERSSGDFFKKTLVEAIGTDKSRPVDRQKFVGALFKYDLGSLIHGVFLESLDGRLRIPRALSSFIEASNIQVAASGGAKVDRVMAEKDEEGKKTAKSGFGNIPFSRDEFVADKIELFVNLDLAQIRGYGLGEKIERLLILLSLFKVRKLIDGDLRLRTACDLEPESREIKATKPKDFALPSLEILAAALKKIIADDDVKKLMTITTVIFNDELKKAKESKQSSNDNDQDAIESGDDTNEENNE